MRFSRQVYVDIHDEDFNGTARASSVLRYMQSCAWEQMRALGPSGEDLENRGQAFVLSALDMNILMPVPTYHTLTATTWACPPRALTFPRGYSLTDEDGTLLAEASANWALVDLTSRQLLRPTALETDYQAEKDGAVRVSRFTLPKKEEMTFAGEYHVTYSQIDYIGHLNNTYYPDMFASFVPMRGRRVSHLCIHFLHEAPLGDTLSIYTKEEGEHCLFLSVRSDGQINAEAEYTFVPV